MLISLSRVHSVWDAKFWELPVPRLHYPSLTGDLCAQCHPFLQVLSSFGFDDTIPPLSFFSLDWVFRKSALETINVECPSTAASVLYLAPSFCPDSFTGLSQYALQLGSLPWPRPYSKPPPAYQTLVMRLSQTHTRIFPSQTFSSHRIPHLGKWRLQLWLLIPTTLAFPVFVLSY